MDSSEDKNLGSGKEMTKLYRIIYTLHSTVAGRIVSNNVLYFPDERFAVRKTNSPVPDVATGYLNVFALEDQPNALERIEAIRADISSKKRSPYLDYDNHTPSVEELEVSRGFANEVRSGFDEYVESRQAARDSSVGLDSLLSTHFSSSEPEKK